MSEFCHPSTLSFTYARNTMCKSNLPTRAATATLEQGKEKLTSCFTSSKVGLFCPRVSHPCVCSKTSIRNAIEINGQIRQKPCS